jgi:hypothetical protein
MFLLMFLFFEKIILINKSPALFIFAPESSLMSSFIVHGGKSLKGSILPQGAKNEALQIIAATDRYCRCAGNKIT